MAKYQIEAPGLEPVQAWSFSEAWKIANALIKKGICASVVEFNNDL